MTDVQPTRKHCSRCGEDKDRSEFGRNRSRSDGLQAYCRSCYNGYNRSYSQRPDAKAKKAAYGRSRAAIERDPRARRARERYWVDPETMRQRRRDAYTKDRQGQIKAVRDWQRRNMDQVRAARRAYIAAHPDYYAKHRHLRRARKMAAGTFAVTTRDWLRLCARFDHRCAYCGADAPLTQEHIVPISRGGHHAIGNLLPVCRPCNLSKHNKLLIEWRAARH